MSGAVFISDDLDYKSTCGAKTLLGVDGCLVWTPEEYILQVIKSKPASKSLRYFRVLHVAKLIHIYTWRLKSLKLSPHQKGAPLAYDDKQLALRAVSYRGKLGGDGGMLNPHDKALPSVCPSRTCHLPAEVRATVLFLSSARCERHRAVLYFPPRRSHDDAGQLLLSVHTVHLSQSCPSPPGWEWLTELPSSWLFQSLPALTAACIIVITRPRPILPPVIHYPPKMSPGSDMLRITYPHQVKTTI